MSRGAHYLATAHFALAAVVTFAALWLAARPAVESISPGIDALGRSATICRVAAVAYLLATAAVGFRLGQIHRHGRVSAKASEYTLLIGQAVLLAVVAAIALRGPAARLYLTGLDHLLAALVTVATLSLALSAAGRWLARGTLPALDFDPRSSPPAAARSLPWIFAVAGLLLIASLGYLESRPLPSENQAPAPTIAGNKPTRPPG